MIINHLQRLLFAIFLFSASPVLASGGLAESQKLLQMLDYMGVDYPPTVLDGRVVDEFEYKEMQEFSGIVISLLDTMPPNDAKQAILDRGAEVKRLIEDRAPGAGVTEMTQALKADLISAYDIIVAPGTVPVVEDLPVIYEANCASCHGFDGYGDGPMAQSMEPAPSDFHDMERQYTRSVYDLFNTITLGVEGTPMPAFPGLSDEQRWALAFMVSEYNSSEGQRATGQRLWRQGVLNDAFGDLSAVTGTSIAGAEALAVQAGFRAQDGADVLAYLRSDPEVLIVSDYAAIDTSITKLNLAVQALERGEAELAMDEALSSYLDGFELAETNISIADQAMKSKIEKEMITFRQLVKEGDVDIVSAQRDVIIDLLIEAKELLNENGISEGAAFAGSFIILLREGVEAILVLAAIMAVLVKTGRREALKYVHIGWIGAVVLGVMTWWVADNLITISGASREITEGVAAIVAAVILVYVGFWLHNASHSKRWKAFVEHRIGNAMESSTLWVLASVSFIAVYREMFETVLFYQAMWVQLEEVAHNSFFSGILTALVLLVFIAVAIFKLGVRLPIRTFFQANAVLLFLLAVVFTGQGIAALQEAGLIGIRLVDFPTVSIIGVYPTAQGLSIQLLVLLLGVALMLYQKKAD